MKWTLWRALGLAVSVALLAVSVHFFVGAIRTSRDIRAKKDATLIYLPVNLSRPGVFSGPISNVLALAHTQEFCVQLSTPLSDDSGTDLPLTPLKAVFSIADAGGTTRLSQDIDGQDLSASAEATIAHVSLSERPGCIATLTVKEGVALPEGTTVRLVGRNTLCGLETWYVIIQAGIGVAAAVPGAAIVALIAWRMRRDRRAGDRK